eukprot:Opistho-2@72588
MPSPVPRCDKCTTGLFLNLARVPVGCSQDKVIEEQEEKEKTAEEIAEARKRAEAEAKLQRGVQAKEEGNSLFAKGEYVRAVECYARAIECDQSNAVYPANRAMAYIKLKKWAHSL